MLYKQLAYTLRIKSSYWKFYGRYNELVIQINNKNKYMYYIQNVNENVKNYVQTN